MAVTSLVRRSPLPVVHSAEVAECGLACIVMVARYYGHDVDLNGIRQRLSLSMTGATLRSLMGLAEQFGLSCRALRAELGELRKVSTPAILHWDLNHFVVMESTKRGRFYIHDPAAGRRRLTASDMSKHFTGVLLEFSQTAGSEVVEARTKTRIRDLWSRIEGFWSSFAQVLALSTIPQAVVFVSPFYLQLAVDEAIQRADSEFLVVLALGFGALVVLQSSTSALRAWTLQSIGFLLSYQMVGNVIHHLMRLKMDYFEKRHVGDILSRVGSINQVREVMTQGVMATIIDGCMALTAAIILFVYSSTLAIVVVGTVGLTLAITFAIYPMQRLRMEEQIMASAKEQTHLIETVRASTVIRLMGAESVRENSWRNLFARVVTSSFAVQKLMIAKTTSQGLIVGLQLIVVVYSAPGRSWMEADFGIGMLFAFMSYRQTFTDRSLALVNQLIQFAYLRMHLDRVGDIVQSEREYYGAPSRLLGRVVGAISIRAVSFRYGAVGPTVLENVCLEVPGGSFMTIAGASGSGKTTLMRLMLGLYQPTAGETRLDGRLPNSFHWRHWRASVGVVSQNDHLLSGTLADNVAFFDPNIDMARVQRACELARVHEDIMNMPMQYLSLVGDMGSA